MLAPLILMPILAALPPQLAEHCPEGGVVECPVPRRETSHTHADGVEQGVQNTSTEQAPPAAQSNNQNMLLMGAG